MSGALDGVVSAATLAKTEQLALQFSQAKPFRHLVIDGFLEPSFCDRLIASFPPYDDGRFRNEYGDRGKAHHEDVRGLGETYVKLDDCARSPEFLGWLRSITGIEELLYDPEYMGGGTHENLHGMDIEPHVDFNVHPHSGLHRRLNMLLYLTEWPASWGGQLGLHSDPMSRGDSVKRVALKRNRCVLFETTDKSWHSVARVTLPLWRRSASRKSFALYYYSKTRADGARPVPADLTMFLDPPVPLRLIRPGRFLTPSEARELAHALTRRDRKIRYLYDRALWWYNEQRLGRMADTRSQILRQALEKRPNTPAEGEESS